MAIAVIQPPAEDTYLSSGATTTNFGTSAFVFFGESAGSVFRTLVQFDLSSIPSGTTVNSATLNLWIRSFTGTNTRTLRVYRVLRNWAETQATWNVYTTGNNWGTAGCANTTTDREATDIGSVSISSSIADHAQVNITLTASAIQTMITGGGFTNNGFLLKMDTESDDAGSFYPREEATFTTERMQITINYGPMNNLPLLGVG